MPGSQLSKAERVIALAENRFPAALYKRCRSALVNLDFLAITNRSDGDESASVSVSVSAAAAGAVDAAVDGVDSAAAVADVDAVAGDGTTVPVLSAAAAGPVDAAVDGVDSTAAVADVDAVTGDGTTVSAAV